MSTRQAQLDRWAGVSTPGPMRIQRRRTKGWRMPEGAVYVGRPSAWGNPWRPLDPDAVWWAVAVGERGDMPGRRAGSVAWYRWWLSGETKLPITLHEGPGDIEYTSGRTAHTADVAAGLAMVVLLTDGPRQLPPRHADIDAWLAPLRGHDLACWCPLDQPCHADVLLELANR